MYREIVHDGDVILQRRDWWTAYVWIGWRNLSEEVRGLKRLEEKARKKFEEASDLRIIAETNVESKKTRIKNILSKNTQITFFSDDVSILDRWDGVTYQDTAWKKKEMERKIKELEEDNKKLERDKNHYKRKGGH